MSLDPVSAAINYLGGGGRDMAQIKALNLTADQYIEVIVRTPWGLRPATRAGRRAEPL